MAYGAPCEPATVLGEMVKRYAQLSPINQLQRQMMDMRVPLAHERHYVVIGVDVQPRSLVAEAVGDPHPKHVAAELCHAGQVAGEEVHVPELARMKARQRGRRASDRRARIVG